MEKVIPMDIFHDQDKLAAALSDLPEQEREKLLSTLSKLSSDLHLVKHRHVEGEDSSFFTENGENIVVIDVDSEELGDDVTKVVKNSFITAVRRS